MPAKGKLVIRKSAPEEIAEIEGYSNETRTDAKKIRQLLGNETTDVYLNDRVFWSNIPVAIWDFDIGGYQVIKKWLSYRERSLLGRSIRLEEATEVTTTARRLAGLVLMQPALNENYLRIRKNTFFGPDSNLGTSTVVRPHSQNLDYSFLFQDLVDQPMLDIDPARVGTLQIT